MKKVKLVTKQEWRFGQKNILPLVGEVQISSTGEIEVDGDKADALVNMEVGFEYSKTQQTTTTTTALPEQTTTTTTHLVVTETTTSSIEPQVVTNDIEKSSEVKLETLTVAKLQELAAPFPKEEWSTLNKKDLVSYLNSKLQ